jgi:hypothetical protein
VICWRLGYCNWATGKRLRGGPAAMACWSGPKSKNQMVRRTHPLPAAAIAHRPSPILGGGRSSPGHAKQCAQPGCVAWSYSSNTTHNTQHTTPLRPQTYLRRQKKWGVGAGLWALDTGHRQDFVAEAGASRKSVGSWELFVGT